MKQRICVMMAMTLILLASGQALCQLPMTFGVKAGMVASNFDIDSELVEFESKSGLAGGSFVVIDIPGLFDIQAEVLYVSKGAKMSGEATDDSGQSLGEFTMKYEINYLEIPVLAKISLGASPAHLLVGPAFAFKSSSKLIATDVPSVGEIHETWEGIADTDISFVIGAGATVPSGLGTIVIDARYTLGMSNIDDDAMGVDVKNNAMMVMVGIAF